MPLSVIRGIVTRKYNDFRGIDLLNPETQVDSRRSPDCLNVWKSYQLAQSNIIETRPGLIEEADWSDENEENNNIYSFFFLGYEGNETAIAHIGDRLLKSDVGTPTQIYSGMAENSSEMALFGNDLLILDGTNYLRYTEGLGVVTGASLGYIPTTTISRSPSRRWRTLRRCKSITT